MTLSRVVFLGFTAFLTMAANVPPARLSADSQAPEAPAETQDYAERVADSTGSDIPASQRAIDRCLSAPSRTCALASALLITAEEELPIARVDTLIAIAETFEQTGDAARAETTVELARQAAEDIGISIGTEQKLARIVGTLAALGQDEEAFEIVQSLSDKYLKSDAMGAIALAQARAGKIDLAQETLDMIAQPLLALRYAVDMTETLAEADDLTAVPVDRLQARLDMLDNRLFQAMGKSRLAVIEARRGNREAAERLIKDAMDALDYVVLNHERARVYAGLATAHHALGNMQVYADFSNRAANLAAGVQSDYDRPIAIADAVSALSVGGDVERATELAASVKDLRAQSALIERLAKRKAAKRTVGPLAPHVLNNARENDSRYERDRARLAVASALAQTRSIEEAVSVIKSIEDDDAQARAMAVLARSLN